MLWAILKTEIKQLHHTSIDELKAYSVEACNRLNQKTIDLLVLSFRFRLELVIIYNGKSITDWLWSGIVKSIDFVIPKNNEINKRWTGSKNLIDQAFKILLPNPYKFIHHLQLFQSVQFFITPAAKYS
jgi:hypothetical protein